MIFSGLLRIHNNEKDLYNLLRITAMLMALIGCGQQAIRVLLESRQCRAPTISRVFFVYRFFCVSIHRWNLT